MDKDKPETTNPTAVEDVNNASSSDSDSGSESDDSSSSGGNGGETLMWTEDECERGRENCLHDLIDLERQFHDLKERFYRERVALMNVQLQEVRNGIAPDYLKKLTALEDNWRTRNEVADVLRQLQLDQVDRLFQGESSALDQNYDNSKRLLYDHLKDDIELRIGKLETDKRNADINLELWLRDSNREKFKAEHPAPPSTAATATSSSATAASSSTTAVINGDRTKRPLSPSDVDVTTSLSPVEKRRKPVVVSGPYVVYMLKESDILEDWNIIRRAALQAEHCDRVLVSTV